MRPVGLLKLGDLLIGERHVNGGDGVVQVAGLGRADDRRGDARLMQQPRKGELGGWQATRSSDLAEPVDHVEVGAGVKLVGVGVGGGAGGAPRTCPGPRASQESVAIERSSGLVVDRLLAASHPVIPIHPNAFHATRPRWGAAGAKSDPGDSYKLAEDLRTDGHRLRRLRPLDAATRHLQALARGARRPRGRQDRGQQPAHAVRILARAWLRVIWACWHHNTVYDPAKHGAEQRLAA
jgi:hypothetical protein